MLRHLLSGVVIVAASVSPVFAADLILDEEEVIVPVEDVFDWTGFYVGVQGGWAAGTAIIDDTFLLDDEEVDFHGGFLGVNASALAQFDMFVLGVEGQVNWSNASGEIDLGGGNMLQAGVDWFGSIDGKAGIAVDRALLYATVGLAAGGVRTGQDDPPDAFSQTATAHGLTAGVGVDFAATDNIIFGLQYRFYHFGAVDFDAPPTFTDRTQSTTLHTIAAKAAVKF